MPSLSLTKLEQLLTSTGFLPKKVFTDRGDCVYLEVMNIANADKFLLYIPSKYEIEADGNDGVYKLRGIELGEDGNIPVDYAGEPDDLDMEKQYEEIDADLSPANANHGDLVEHMESHYEHTISLKDMTKDDKNSLRNVFRQLRRLRNCVRGVKYKLAIVYKNYLCAIRRDDTMEGYKIKGYPTKDSWTMYIVVDLETLFSKKSVIGLDIRTVRDAIYRVLDRNQIKHTRGLKRLFDRQKDIDAHSAVIIKHKSKYTGNLETLYAMLARMELAERKVLDSLMVIESRRMDSGGVGLHTDMERITRTSKLEKELEAMSDVKQDIIKNILTLRHQQETLALRVDRIFFETSIMLDAILKNMSELESLQKICV